MMRKFKLDNVVKVTDSEVKAKKYLAKGFTEITEKTNDVQVIEDENTEDVDLETLEASELKAIADERGIEYVKNANKEKMLELLKAGE